MFLTTPTSLFILSCISGLIGCIFSYRIALFLDKQGEDINFLNLRWHMNKYLRMYKEATLRNDGKIGRSYYVVYISWTATIVLFTLAIGSKLNAL
jgi:hypothetical protein